MVVCAPRCRRCALQCGCSRYDGPRMRLSAPTRAGDSSSTGPRRTGAACKRLLPAASPSSIARPYGTRPPLPCIPHARISSATSACTEAARHGDGGRTRKPVTMNRWRAASVSGSPSGSASPRGEAMASRCHAGHST
eukprot:6552161-Prymnesium_polylepis.2